MKVGDYVRTNEGISKIIDIKNVYKGKFIATDNDRGIVHFSNNYRGYIIIDDEFSNEEDKKWIKKNIKENPIDLIEVGDYVNGERVTPLMIRMRDEQGVFGLPDSCEIYVDEIKVKSIVTKEQFSQMEYWIGE